MVPAPSRQEAARALRRAVERAPSELGDDRARDVGALHVLDATAVAQSLVARRDVAGVVMSGTLRVIALSADGWLQEADARALGLGQLIHEPVSFDRLLQVFDDCDGCARSQ